jgi:hypothetical protein
VRQENLIQEHVVQALIFPVVLLLLLALWGVLENGRKFRREFRLRGKSWQDLCAEMEKGEGLVVVDTIWGPQRGLGRPVIWWLPTGLAPGDDLGGRLESVGRLVKCPRKMKKIEALRQRFGPPRVVLHSWAVGTELLQMDEKGDSA